MEADVTDGHVHRPNYCNAKSEDSVLFTSTFCRGVEFSI
jgi:hypothetical protein